MAIEYSKKFEKIDDDTSRLRVYGGWIIRTIAVTSGGYYKTEGVGVHTFFMQDVMNVWKLKGE